jgi:hypothetical protein
MIVRFKSGTELPTDWHPGQPVPGQSVDLRGTQECPFGADCHSCAIGLQWHPGFETHMKRPTTG